MLLNAQQKTLTHNKQLYLESVSYQKHKYASICYLAANCDRRELLASLTFIKTADIITLTYI